MEDRTKAYFKLTNCIIFFSLELIFCSISSIEITPSFSLNSYSFGVASKFKISPNFFIYHKNNFFKTNYPFERPVIYQKVRNKSTGVNEQSYLSINDDMEKINIWFGRRYLDSGPSVISGLFISPESPAVDNLSYQFKLSDKIKLQSNIIRLDSRKEILDDGDGLDRATYMYFNRWYYHHRVELKYTDFLIQPLPSPRSLCQKFEILQDQFRSKHSQALQYQTPQHQ